MGNSGLWSPHGSENINPSMRRSTGRGSEMSPPSLKPRVEVVALHPDVLSEHFSEDIFALDLSERRFKAQRGGEVLTRS